MNASSAALTGRGVPLLFRLSPRAAVRALMQSSPAHLLLQAYLFFEYVRPQSIYTSLAFFPWARASLFGALVFAVLEGRPSFRHGKALWAFLALFTAVILLSSVNAIFPAVSADNAFVWMNWIIVMILLGSSLRTINEFALVLAAYCLWNLKMTQHAVRSWAAAGFQFRNWGVTGAPGWFQNSGEFGIEMCIFVPIMVALTAALWPHLTRWRRITLVAVTFSAVIGVVGSSSRGALLGLAAVAAWAILVSPHRWRLGAIVSVVALAVWLFLPNQSKLRWQTAGEDQTSLNRITYWEDGLQIAEQHPVLGIGYQNWLPYYKKYYNPEGELPHNYFIECVSQLGYTGLAVLCAILVAFFVLNAHTRRRTQHRRDPSGRLVWNMAFGLDGAMVGFLASGFFVSVLWYPFLWVNIGFALGLAAVSSDRLEASGMRRAATRRSREFPSRRTALNTAAP